MTVESVGPMAIGVVASSTSSSRPISSGVEKVTCTWFEGKKQVRSSFIPETLAHDDGMPVIG